MITGFLTFVLWLVVSVIAGVFFGINEKPKRPHHIRNVCLYILFSSLLGLGLVILYNQYWDWLMLFWLGIIMLILMLIGLFSKR